MSSQSQSDEAVRRTLDPTNAEILGSTTETLPPTLHDLEATSVGFPFTIDEIIDISMSLVVGIGWESSKWLSSLRWLNQLDDRLPLPSPQDHSVYLVVAPHSHRTKSRFRHWSIYSQGYFYHLTAAGSNIERPPDVDSGQSLTSSEPRRFSPVSLKVQNALDPKSPEFIPRSAETERRALQAYHIGCTRFTPSQILKIATNIIGLFRNYNFFSYNCQLFASTMAVRTVMTRRNGSVFVGSIHQIAAWDSAGASGKGTGFHTRATGYVLANPQTEDGRVHRSIVGRLFWYVLDDWRSLRRERHAQQIRVLYRDGPGATYAFDPKGERGSLSYALHVFKESQSDYNIWEDIKNGKWRDAWYGRLEERKNRYVDKEIKSRRGSGSWTLLLPVYRWCRGVTQEEEKLWAAEAVGILEVEAASAQLKSCPLSVHSIETGEYSNEEV